MKMCSKCFKERSFDSYSKHKKSVDGLRQSCKLCDKEYRISNANPIKSYQATYRTLNKEKSAIYHKVYVEKNRERISNYTKKYKKLYNIKNSEKLKLYSKFRRSRDKGKINFLTAKRRSLQLNATPIWLTEFDLNYIRYLYIQAKELEKLDGIKYHVDHIIPLRNDLVCGLHVPWNLQILTKEENLKKGNKL